MKDQYLKKVKAVFANQPHRTFKPKELARKIGVPKTQYAAFRDALKKYAQEGLIAKYKGNNFGTIKRATTIEGELHVKTQGYGFLITEEDKEDVFISQKNMNTAMHKDIVRVQLYADSKGKRLEGRVIEIVTRARTTIVGVYKKSKRFGFVIPDDLKMTRDIFIHQSDSMGTKSGQKVVARITDWPDERTNPEGEIIEILGWPDDPGVDVTSLVKSFELATTFPANVETEVKRIPTTIPRSEIKRRLDLRSVNCFTIDPKDAKDFDDAISIRKLGKGHYELGVHIADVSYYVTEGSVVDKEALQRATSIYLVDRVIPMLPEKLSNELCSLRENEDRLTMSCIMEIEPNGKVVKYRIAESVIRSKKRFTYEQVQAVITGAESGGEFAEDIKLMHKLSKVLMHRRKQMGSLDFDLPEVTVELNKVGEPIAIKQRERTDSHRLVEEFMLLANQTVTEHVDIHLGRDKRPLPFIYRIHEAPSAEKIEDFRTFVKALGLPLNPHKKVTGKLLGQYLESLSGRPEENLIQDLMLRSMMKAKYSTENVGHFGLAFKHYTHFTSPIRRYADLEVHRLLKAYQHKFDYEQFKAKTDHLAAVAQKASERELVALQAERESIKLKKVEYMRRHLGDEFDGIISGVVQFGIFVEIVDLLVEGLVHISDLEDDYYIHDEKNYQLIGQRTENTYRLGDLVKVRVVRVDIDERIIDFVLVKE